MVRSSTCSPSPVQSRFRLLGLPKGVTAVGDNYHIDSDTEELAFTLKATEEALLGQYKELKCEIAYVIDGQSIRQVTQNGTLRVDPAVNKGRVKCDIQTFAFFAPVSFRRADSTRKAAQFRQ